MVLETISILLTIHHNPIATTTTTTNAAIATFPSLSGINPVPADEGVAECDADGIAEEAIKATEEGENTMFDAALTAGAETEAAADATEPEIAATEVIAPEATEAAEGAPEIAILGPVVELSQTPNAGWQPAPHH